MMASGAVGLIYQPERARGCIRPAEAGRQPSVASEKIRSGGRGGFAKFDSENF
jgi:hypothetical protein